MENYKNQEDLRHYRLHLLHNALNFEKVERIPNMSFFVTWKYIDAGYKLSEVFNDYNKLEDATIRHQELYNFDLLLEAGGRNLYRPTLPLGEPGYIFDDEVASVSVREIEFVTRDQFRAFADNPKKFIWEVVMPVRYPKFFEDADITHFSESYYEYRKFMDALGTISHRLTTQFGLPAALSFGCPKNPVEWTVNWMRGIKGFCLDMRQDPELVHAAFDAFKEVFYDPQYNNIKAMAPGKNPETMTDCGTSLLGHTLMNPNQWDEFYWPYIGGTLKLVAEKDKSCRLFIQGSCARFWDYFADMPKGSLMFSLENDDLVETRKALPNVCLNGGIPVEMLGHKSPEYCVNYVKKIVDDLGGIGLILTEDKMGTYNSDARPETLKAVCDFALNYTDF